MKYAITTSASIIGQYLSKVRNHFFGVFFVGLSLSLVSCSSSNESIEDLQVDSALQQIIFTSPERAAQSFFDAISDNDVETLKKILGANFQNVLPIESLTSQDSTNFIAAWQNKNSLITDEKEKYKLIVVGKNQWTLPIPIVSNESGWFFNVEQGIDLIDERHIGKNELNVIQVFLAYQHAQQEYLEQDHDGDGQLEYAQKLISSPEVHDGLFWDGNPSEKVGYLKELLANKEAKGSYHGYYYKLLNTQNDNSKTASFSLVAWPKNYALSGVMSFYINEQGSVLEQDLGPESSTILASMNTYDAASGWEIAKEESLIR